MNPIVKNPKTYLSPAGWFTFDYPKNWVVTEDEDCTTLYKKSIGVGAIQISAYETSEQQWAANNLREYLVDEGIRAEVERLINDDHEIARAVYDVGDSHILVFFITKGHHLVFITYTVDLKSKEIEKKEVDWIITSVRIVA